MNTFKKTGLLIVLLITSIQLSAQSYNTAIGLRLGTEWGLTVQQRIAKFTTVEAIIQQSFGSEETSVSLLLEQHKRLISKRFNFYVGAGIQKGWTGELDSLNEGDPFGIPLIAGAEFTISNLVLSYDFKPVINVLGGSPLAVQSGLSLRYVFWKRPRETPIKDKFGQIKENRAEKKAEKAKQKEKERKQKEKEERKQKRKDFFKNIFKKS